MILPERSKNKDDIKRSKTSLKIQVHSLPWPHLKSDMGVLFWVSALDPRLSYFLSGLQANP